MRAALVGGGRIAREHLGCLRDLPGVELAAVCDLSPAAAELAATRFGARRWFTDHGAMLEAVRPHVVHITTPPDAHLPLALQALAAGSHVFVEKPAGRDLAAVEELLDAAEAAGRHVVESYNYVFNRPVRRLRELARSGELGDVVHVDVELCLDILGDGSPFVDLNHPHPILGHAGGAIADFLPHLASLVQVFAGDHVAASATWIKRGAGSPLPADELRAMVEGERATASVRFSSHGRPEGFRLAVLGTRMRATAGLFEPRLVVERVHGGPRPLDPVRNGLAESREAARAAIGGLIGKLSGAPVAYEGLWTLIAETYAGLAGGAGPPVSTAQIRAVHRLMDDLTRNAPS